MDWVCRAYENLLACLKSTFGESQRYAFCCERSQCCERSGCCVFLLGRARSRSSMGRNPDRPPGDSPSDPATRSQRVPGCSRSYIRQSRGRRERPETPRRIPNFVIHHRYQRLI